MQETWVPQLPVTNCPSFYQILGTTLLPNFHLHALPICWDTPVTHIRSSQYVWIITYFLRPFSTTTLTTEYTKSHYFLFLLLTVPNETLLEESQGTVLTTKIMFFTFTHYIWFHLYSIARHFTWFFLMILPCPSVFPPLYLLFTLLQNNCPDL